MAVLINGIEMPKGADEHRLIIRANGQVIIDKKTYWEEAKAVPVPPHGRLIDADALHELFEYQWHHLQVLNWNGNPTAKARQSGINWCISTMRDSAPTIIPAEEGE